MRKIGVFTVFIIAFLALTLPQAQASSNDSSGPIFLNKIKSVFSRDKTPQQIAPLNTKTAVTKRSTNGKNTSSTGQSLADIKRAEWRARQQRLGALIDKNNQEIRTKIAQNYQQSQQYQAALQAQQRANGQTAPLTSNGARGTTQSSPTQTAPTRIIIPQKEESGGTKPIFKNYR